MLSQEIRVDMYKIKGCSHWNSVWWRFSMMAEPCGLFIHSSMLLLQAKRGVIIYLEKTQFSTVRKSNLPLLWQDREIDMKKRNRSISWGVGNNYEWIDSHVNIWIVISQMLWHMDFMYFPTSSSFKGLIFLNILHSKTFYRSVYAYQLSSWYWQACSSNGTVAFPVRYVGSSKVF